MSTERGVGPFTGLDVKERCEKKAKVTPVVSGSFVIKNEVISKEEKRKSLKTRHDKK